MPWYKTGTVNVQNNVATVTGTNTAFAANSRVGDAFRGPDGGWYEVVNIASDTVLSISPNYQGVTNAVGIYALTPMQGYVKDSADTLRALVNEFGNKLALLRTTGNYEVLPVAKGGTGSSDSGAARLALGLATAQVDAVPVVNGGTGGTSPAAARAGLQLGTASTANIGSDAGSVMQVGSFGLGSPFNPGLVRISNASNSEIYPTGFYRYDGLTVDKPTFGTGYGSMIELSAIFSGGANYGGQIAVDYATAEMGFRSLSGSSGFSAWCKLYHTSNTTRAADGTLKAI